MLLTKPIKRGPRRQRSQFAWIASADGAIVECRLADISNDGAKIASTIKTEVGGRFDVWFVPDQSDRRQCEVDQALRATIQPNGRQVTGGIQLPTTQHWAIKMMPEHHTHLLCSTEMHIRPRFERPEVRIIF
jgi:hypothetical protein